MEPTLPRVGEPRIAPALARLPSVDRLLLRPEWQAAIATHGHALAKQAVQAAIAAARLAAKAGAAIANDDAIAAAATTRLDAWLAPRLKTVFNLSGTVIHTNLGRALLAEEAIAAVATAMRAPVALEFDLDGGRRGDRDEVVAELLRGLTGAPAATVVNNGAAAVLLTLTALAARKEVLISRGELIEIGGAFRIPDIMKTAGCKLVEVGTTNRTHAADFESAIGPRSGLVMKVHASNYAITGFTAAVAETELARIAHENQLPLVVDLGAGALVDLSQWGLPREPLPQDSIAAGADLVIFSGDKLLGGPQAGIIVGRADLIERIKRHPLKRALRVSKLTLAALEATLRIVASAHRLPERLPTLALLSRPPAAIRASAEGVWPALAAFVGPRFTVSLADCASQIGSGAQPVERLASVALRIAPVAPGRGGLPALETRLRRRPVPVIGRIHDGALWLDARCLTDEAGFIANLAAPC
ncbi:MAG: L-seryl-tRNA(Sec) selenium transferase [Burkholderiaceae bacterium]